MHLLWLVIATSFGLVLGEDFDQYQEFITTESDTGLFPSIFNLATNSLITATSTCGQTHRETYCHLVEHVLLRRTSQDRAQCDICDANDVSKRHPIEFAIDGTRRWWQSPSLANGLHYEKINITIDMRQEYQVAYIVVKMGNSPRPGTWVLEKSLDGENYMPWQYFAMNDAECMRQFGIPATTGVPKFQRDDEVHCTSEFSKITPLESGEIHISLVNGRPGVTQPSLELQKHTRARFIRLRLLTARTLNADLMIINNRSHTLDRSVTMRYFYSISDISIGGQCICYGHAESCPSDPVTGQFKCECRHNTYGESCNRCAPLFNQLPWKPGTNAQPNVCQQCQCFNHADSCVYDEELDRNKWSITPEGVYEGGGRCVECKHNTEGFNCEKCQDGFYRPSGLSHYREDACRACDCDLEGSMDGVCIRDDQSASNGLHPGDCVCKPGFGGRRCERCAIGFRNYPKCEPCPCNQAGSVNFDTCEEANCQCKANVEGLYCDKCKPGTIHLSASNPQGCQPCFCFGLTSNCTEIDWATAKISNNNGWNLTDLTGSRDERPETENGEVLMFNANQNKDRTLYYWKAPQSFLGNLLNSYGGNLHYYVYYVPQEQDIQVPIADVIIEGNGIKLEYYSRMEFFPRENMTVQIPIIEGNGWYNSASRQSVDKADMMRALAHVEKFMVRAMYQQQQLQSSIFGLTLDTAVPSPEPSKEVSFRPPPVDSLMRGVEVCSCPDNFGGNSCESCISGYRRVHNQLYGGRCEKCNCKGHSDHCDPFTGHCLDCQHNTTGARCELCLPGYYGNPSLGGELGACKRCECPTEENSRSGECVMTQLVVAGSVASQEDAYVCTACERGYEGNKCEVCADGFFGDPLGVNGTCKECECNGNVDSMAIGNCDTTTGTCLKCIGETTGAHCEMCKENHWGSALQHTCRACGCHRVGAVQQQCRAADGTCECKENYIGKQCEQCVDGHGDVENGCPPCECDETGAIGTECDAISGQCTCKQGVFGKRCDQCRPSYFNFTDNGCQFCRCNIYGSIDDGKCDSVTGKCECRENVDGQMCEKCAEGFFNITSATGCQDCACDSIGSEGTACDIVTGQCVCKPGVTGLKCDKCAPNHYGMDVDGCKECQACPAPGQVCDSETGDCVCPPNTIGEICENCTTNAWDYHPLKGCKLCECSSIGSADGKCNVLTGQCACKEGYVGLKCDRCTHGFFNFPTCEPCNCNPAGTDPLQCKDGLCLCNEKGECPCKKNVEGEKCDKCKASTFSLDASSPLGCTSCFCFNRTDQCEQSSLVWQQLYSEDRRAVFEEPWQFYTKKHNLNILPETPARFNSYPTDTVPLYWNLPKQMLGDRTTSYNGFLRFTIENEDNRRGIHGVRPDQQYFRYFPQVVLVGNNRLELEHIPMEISEDGKYKIRLHETQWRLRQSPEIVLTRKTLMVALQNLQGVYIRGTYNYPARGDAINLKEISIDVAVPKSSTSSENVALGVEQCSACPRGYTGLSCQNPAEEYCRRKQNNYLNSADDMALVGWSEPCQCHGHSTKCHPETCSCTDCEHNTMGEYCETCRPGFIGDAREGGAAACTKCACPLEDNSFSDTCVAVTYGRGYVCNNCRRGYTGQYCESCISGYFGNPETPGGFCEECGCHPDGSKHARCDPITGVCECRPGVTGRDCSRCQERHAFIRGVCTSCDQGCYLPLMTMIDEMEVHLAAQNFSNLKPIPWKRIYRIGNTTELISTFVTSFSTTPGEETEIKEIVQDSKYAKDTFNVIDEASFQVDRMDKAVGSLQKATEEVEAMIKKTQKTYADIYSATQFLQHFHQYGGSSVGGATLDGWLIESEARYNATLERGEYIEKRLNRAEQEYKNNEELLKKVFANKLNDTAFEVIKTRLEEFGDWLQAYRETIYQTSTKDTADAERMNSLVAKRVERFEEVANEIERLKAEAEDQLNVARNDVDMAKRQELLNLFDDARAINTSLTTAAEYAEQCQNVTQLYAQLIDEYDEQFVDPSKKHAVELQHQSEELQGLFKNTKAETENSLKASAAYEDIVGALRNASDAAVEAQKAAEDAFTEADGDSENAKTFLAEASFNESKKLEERSRELSDEWKSSGYEDEAMTLNDRLTFVNEMNIDMTKRMNNFKNQFDQIDSENEHIVASQNSINNAEKRADQALLTTKGHKQAVKDLAEETSLLENNTHQGIQEFLMKMREVRQQLNKATGSLGKMETVTVVNREKTTSMKEKIARLKNKIAEAREKARQIQLSLLGDERGFCRRSFISPSNPSPSNSFSMQYRPQLHVPDSAILVTKTKQRRTRDSEYLALEVKEKRVVAHWNIGSGHRKATNSHPINFIPSKYAWYHIDIVRAGNGINLTVSLQENAGAGEGLRRRSEPVSVQVGKAEMDNDVVFNTVPGETMVSMGCLPGEAKDIGLSSEKFHGTVGSLRVDEENIPLWNFAHNSDTCGAVKAPTAPSSAGGFMFRNGFAQVNMNLDTRDMVLKVPFSGYSSNGLLYFRGSQESGDFIAMYLEDGHVVLKINLGGTATASLTSKNAYNDGMEHEAKAIWSNQEIQLRVDTPADHYQTVVPGPNTVLNIENDHHYVAGVPDDFDTSKFAGFGIQFKGFFGCIGTVKPTQITEIYLEKAVRWQRREPGCRFSDNKLSPRDRSVGFPEPGYLVTKGVAIDNNSTFGFAFRTKEENGTLIFQSSKLSSFKRRQRDNGNGKGFMAFYLFRGYIVLHFGKDASSRKEVVTIRSTQTYNDGFMHSVFLVREGTNIRLRVDDRQIGEETLSDESVVGSSTSQMHIGGFSKRHSPPSTEIPSATAMIGCISDIYINYKRLSLVPEDHKAKIGVCERITPSSEFVAEEFEEGAQPSARKDSRIVHLLDRDFYENIDPQTADKPSSERTKSDFSRCGGGFANAARDGENAVRYGVSKGSHSRINFQTPETYPNMTAFTLSFSLKTDKADGMAWVWANYRNYTRYFYLNIIDGFATIEVKGKGDQPKILKATERRLNDGQWHDIVLTKKDRLLSLVVDELAPVSMNDCPAPKVMRRRMYVGGVISKHRSQFGLATPPFDGCMKDFKVNEVPQKLDHEDFSRDIIPCSRPTKGIFVHDGGMSSFEGIQKALKSSSLNEIDVAFEWRPISSEGVMLAILANSNPMAARITVETNFDKLNFTIVHKDSGLHLSDAIPTKSTLCDGKWHSLRLKLQPGVIHLDVDGEQNDLMESQLTAEVIQRFVNLPFNIGGVSATVGESLGIASLPGCYRELKLSGKAHYFEKAQKYHRVLIDACPFH